MADPARSSTASAAEARDVAEAMARGELMVSAALAPDPADAMIRELTNAGTLTHDDLDRIVGTRLGDADRIRLQDPEIVGRARRSGVVDRRPRPGDCRGGVASRGG